MAEGRARRGRPAKEGRTEDILEAALEVFSATSFAALSRSIQRGIDRGEFRPTAAVDLPQAIAGPAVLAALWKLLFDAHRPLDLEALCEVHLDVVMRGLRRVKA